MRHLDIDDLRTFVETIKHGSFSASARALSISQPAVSRRIRKLEDELGFRLLDRSDGLFSPTREGLEFLRFAKLVLREYESLKNTLSQMTPVRGTIYISASTTLGEHVLPGPITQFLSTYPEVNVAMHVMDSDMVEDCVEARHCDVGFLGRPPRRGILAHIPIGQDEIVLAIPAAHRFRGRAEVPLSALEGESFVHRQESSGTRRSVEEILLRRGVSLPPHRSAVVVNTVAAQISAIAAGQGVGFISRHAIEASGGSKIAYVRLKDHPLMRTLYMVYDPSRNDAPIRTFVRFMAELTEAGSNRLLEREIG